MAFSKRSCSSVVDNIMSIGSKQEVDLRTLCRLLVLNIAWLKTL